MLPVKLGRSFRSPINSMFGPMRTRTPESSIFVPTLPDFESSRAPSRSESHTPVRPSSIRLPDAQSNAPKCLAPFSHSPRPAPDASPAVPSRLDNCTTKQISSKLTPTASEPNCAQVSGVNQTLGSKAASRITTLYAEYLKMIADGVDIELKLVEEGVGGTYFLKPKSTKGCKVMAVFKPADEEPGAKNNPKGYDADDNEKGNIKAGEGWVREVLAFSLDHYNFAHVPETIRIQLPNHLFQNEEHVKGCKLGSLQRFVQSSDGTPCKASCDMGPGTFPAEDVHRIGQLDIRLLNCDRHGGNALVRKDARGAVRLVPIDHSYILPRHAADLDFEWLFWPQSKQPFSAETAAYIAGLQPEADAALMRKYGAAMGEDCIELMKAATLTLQRGCAQGLSLRTIGRFMRRERLYERSAFELVTLEARRPLDQGGDIDMAQLEVLLADRLGALSESPLVRPVIAQPVSLKEQVLASGVTVETMAPDSADGTYLIKLFDGECLAVFKSSLSRRTRSVHRGKDRAIREVAAYRLDEGGWAGVPETVEMRIPNELFPKRARLRSTAPFRQGSLQKFVPGDLLPLCTLPTATLPIPDVHRVGILDLRLCNPDRHCRSLWLVRHADGTSALVPTSHASVLPTTLADIRFPWRQWPQAQEPFAPDEVQYVRELDPELDTRVLLDLGINPDAVELHRLATLVLQAGVAQGCTLRQLGLLFERPTQAEPSGMERLAQEIRLPLNEGGHLDFEKLTSILAERLEFFFAEHQEGSLAGLPPRWCSCSPSASSASDHESESSPNTILFTDESDDSSSALDVFESPRERDLS